MARWAHHQAHRSIYTQGRRTGAAPPTRFSPRTGQPGGRVSGPRPQRPPRPSGQTAAGSGLQRVMGRASESGLRGRNGGRLRRPLRLYHVANGPSAPPGTHPSVLWPLDLPPPIPWPPAGPRRRLPYLRSPGPPFYFLKPSHKAPRRPRLACFRLETCACALPKPTQSEADSSRLRTESGAESRSRSPSPPGQAQSTRLRTNRLPSLFFPADLGGVDRAERMRSGPCARCG